MEKKVILKKGKDQSLQRFHPWVFSGAVAKILGDPENGDTIKVLSSDGTLIGKGHFQKGSIMVRMLVGTTLTSMKLSGRTGSRPLIPSALLLLFPLKKG